MKDVTFPRYKFTDYGKNNNNIVQTTRTAAYADAVVIDVKEWISALKTKFYIHTLQHIGVTVDEKNEYIKFVDDVDLQSAPNLNEYVVAHSHYGKNKNILETIVQAYNEFAGTKILNVFDLNSVINGQNGPMTSDVAEQLTQLLKSSDKETVKLGMEMMTNYDLESSLLHIMLMASQAGNNFRYHDYWSSVNFKAFREKFRQIAGTYVENLAGDDPNSVLQRFLTNDKSFVLEEDLPYIKSVISEQIKGTFSLSYNGFILNSFDFDLNIREDQIIRAQNKEQLTVNTLLE